MLANTVDSERRSINTMLDLMEIEVNIDDKAKQSI